MASMSLPETLLATVANHKLQIVTLIGDLSRAMNLLTVDIEHEEGRTGVRDIADPNYPALARSLNIARQSGWEARDNQDGESVSRRDYDCRDDGRAQEFF